MAAFIQATAHQLLATSVRAFPQLGGHTLGTIERKLELRLKETG